MFVRHGFWCCLTLPLIWACAAISGPRAAAPDTKTKPRVAAPAAPPATIHLPSGSVGPYLMPAGNGWVAAWASPIGDVLNWHTGTFGQDGLPSAAPRRLMEAPLGLTTLRLRAMNPQRGLVVGAFESDDSDAEEPTYGLSTLVVSSAGTMLAGNATLIEECEAIVWIDVVPVTNGALVAWAENLGDRAALFSVIVNLDGHRESDVFTLHEKAGAWQLVRHDKGAMLGVVTSEGNVDYVAIGAGGQPIQRRTLLDDQSAESDIDLAASGDRVLVAFSSRRELEPRLHSAWVGLDGGLHSDVQPVTKPFGATTLIGLRSTASGPVMLWQNTSQEPDMVRIGKIGGDGRLTGEAVALALPPTTKAKQPHDLLVPQVETTATGLMVMQPPCAGSRECRKHADVLEISTELEPRTRLSWSQRAGADLVWDFQCGPLDCAALAANFGSRTRIQLLTTAMAKRVTSARRDSGAAAGGADPFQGSVRAILSTPELAALEAIHIGKSEVLTTLSAFDPNTPYQVPTTPAPDGRLAPVQAQLTTQVVANPDGSNGPRAAENTPLSIRARSVAGVDVTGKGNEALVVWTAIDNQKPQVFLTSIDENGHKIRQSMLTRQTTGEVLALGAATAKDGSYYVTWVREEGASNKVYASRVSSTLTRQAPDTLIAETTGTIANVDIVATATAVWAVFAESTDGKESLKWLRLNPATLQPHKGAVPNPIPVAPEAARFAPRLTSWGDDMVLSWLTLQGDAAKVNLLHLDAKGDVLRAFETAVPGEPSTLNIRCEISCRMAITGEMAGEARGYVAVAHLPAGAAEPHSFTARVVSRQLSPLGTQVRAAVSPTDAYYFDVQPGAERGAVHQVTWHPAP